MKKQLTIIMILLLGVILNTFGQTADIGETREDIVKNLKQRVYDKSITSIKFYKDSISFNLSDDGLNYAKEIIYFKDNYCYRYKTISFNDFRSIDVYYDYITAFKDKIGFSICTDTWIYRKYNFKDEKINIIYILAKTTKYTIIDLYGFKDGDDNYIKIANSRIKKDIKIN